MGPGDPMKRRDASTKPDTSVHGRCGAKRRRTDPPEYCRNRAGFKTDHVGIGRCHLHGGATPVKHGMYSKVKRETLRDLVMQCSIEDDWTFSSTDLAAARAALEEFFNRYSKGSKQQVCAECGTPAVDPTKVVPHIEIVFHVLRRVEKLRARREARPFVFR